MDVSDARCRYCPMMCEFVGKQVWAILTKQADGTWRIVNCLDKEESCFSLECAFTTSGGRWPYPGLASSKDGAPHD